MKLLRNEQISTLKVLFAVAILFCSAAVGQEVNPTSEAPVLSTTDEKPANETEKPKVVLTGDPQKDYIHDPNLPRELDGFDLSDYPFYKRVPNVEFNFTCDGRHDGFYASIPHKCQVYHHCVNGIRYDFLCANYTAFDQSLFNCHFANQVDCKNSELYFDRNDALYKEESTTTTTTTTTTPKIKIVYVERPPKRGQKGKRRTTTQAPVDDYYYYDYIDEPKRGSNKNDAYYYYDEPAPPKRTTTTTTTTTTTKRPIPKRQKRPIRTRVQSINGNRRGNDQFAAHNDPSQDYDVVNTQPRRPRPNANRPVMKRRRKIRKKTTTTTTTTPEPEYYDEYYYDYYEDEPLPSSTTTTTKQPPPNRRPLQGSRPTAADRRKALIEAQKVQRQQVAERYALQAKTAEPAAAVQDYIYEDTAFAEDTATVIEEPPLYTDIDYQTDIQPQRANTNRRRRIQNARRPAAFKRPRNRRLRNKTPGE